MKERFNNSFVKKILFFVFFTIFMMTLYYKIIPIISNYGTEPFYEKDFTKTSKFEQIFCQNIQTLESSVSSGIKLDSYNGNMFSFQNRANTNIEYILNIEKTNGETMLLSNIIVSDEELIKKIEQFKTSRIYYICSLNSLPETNQEYLKYYQFKANQDIFKKLDVYIRIDEFDTNDYTKSLKNNYEEFSRHLKEIIAVCIISAIICIVLLISITKNTNIKRKNSYFDNLYIEEIIVIISLISIEGVKFISGEHYAIPNIIKWIIYFVIYWVITGIYFAIIKRIKSKNKDELFLMPKVLECMKYIYIPIIIYIILGIATYEFIINNSHYYIGVSGYIAVILTFSIILLHLIKLRIELIEINQKIQKIGQGEINTKIVAKNIIFIDLVENINNIKKGMKESIEEKLKSERLKTDLITNVSHDLKTPLTSIINYADLLGKEKIENEKAQKYIQILKTKSKKLKGLTEDLIEASKISSGNETINFEKLNLAEMVLQANGEFAEKFEEKRLMIISNIQKEKIILNLDSKKMWRVLENIYNNIYKYAMENTRVYVSLIEENNKVIFTIKNISKDELNISPNELIERFVRGDKSRNTTGNGLGLSISKDLVTLQKGRLNIDIQGDLFTVNIIF